ncbi:Fic family protein [Microbacterium sp. AK031]|uniref:Fic family protein n=1 Tax=Microbacterium sp. AK031 TaxID=2723076 RepID=UPI00216A70C6|nr:Fic family protein [Microbacterium sp. AK031]MCS3844590.1 Fic family protein [Microbacterium sp. AK031]
MIAEASVPLSASLQGEAEDAIREITRFDAEVSAVLTHRGDGDGLSDIELAPLASVLLRTESASSSEIEGITAGARALALAAIEEKSGVNAQLVTANVAAMQKALAMSDEISIRSVLAAHESLLTGHPYADPGRLRTEAIWIGGAALSPHAAEFVPPHHSRLPELMDDLVLFAQRVDLPVLVQVAIAHAQFETIHPFNGGNGRTGRALVHAMLRRAEVTRRLTIPVSAGLLTDTPAYFDALSEYRAGRIVPIIDQFVTASFRAVANGQKLVSELDVVCRSWSARLASRQGSAARLLLPHLLNQPAVNVKFIVAVLGVTATAAQRAVAQLEAAEILSPLNANRRNRVWLAGEVLDALDGFAERVRRRR